MRATFKNVGLVTLGVILGVAVTMQFSALAHKPVEDAMPIDSLHQLAHAYDVVRADYVEQVDERKLLTNADVNITRADIADGQLVIEGARK